MAKVKKLAGFTLLELLIVLAIIGALTLIIVPNTVSLVRDQKIEAQNDKAYDVYTSVQNYLTDMQIKGRVLSCSTSGDGSVFPEKAVNGKIIFAVEGVPGTNTSFSTCTFTTSCPAADATKEKNVIDGIAKYLGSGYEDLGAWTCQIDADTYTVDWVLVANSTGSEGLTKLESLAANITSGKLYEQTYSTKDVTTKGVSQSYDTQKGDPTYVGQYPIPYTTK